MTPRARLADVLLTAVLTACLLFTVLVLAVTAPFLILLRLTLPVLPRRWRSGARFALVVAVYLATFECGTLAGTVGLRLRHPRVTDESRLRYEDLLGRCSGAFFGPGLRLAGVRMPPIAPPPGLDPDRPLVVIARHAGFINAQLIAHLIINVLARHPRGIVKRAVRADPGFGTALDGTHMRLFRWTRKGRVHALMALLDMAKNAGAGHGLIIFPEGTNFTAERRRKAVSELRERGKDTRAEACEAMPHMMPPIVTGSHALVSAAPGADVVLFGHTGLEDLLSWCVETTPGSASGALHTTLWRIAAEDVPQEKQAFERWLYGQWRELDAWVASVRGTAAEEDDPSMTLTIAGNRRRSRKSSAPGMDRAG